MEAISSLRSSLVVAVGEAGVQNEQELFDELTVNRSRLLSVFDVGPRNPNELKEIQQGRARADFVNQVTFLAQHLNCSERHCASLLQTVQSSNPNIAPVQAVEYAVLAHHQMRRQLADCLRFIFEAARVAQRGVGTPFHARLADYAKRHLVGTGGDGSLASRLFKQVDQLGHAIVEANTAVTNAVSNTNMPGSQGGQSNLGHAVLSARLESLTYERRTLAFAFYYIARVGFLTSSEVKLVLEWLEKHPKTDMTLYILASLFAAFDLSYSSPGSESAEHKIAFAKDQTTLSFIKRKLAPATEWVDASLKAAVLLKWTLLLTEARYRDSTLEHREGFRNEDLEMLVFNAVQGDAFTFLLRVISQVSTQKNGSSQLLNQLNGNDGAELKTSVSDEFKHDLLHEIELLLRSLLTQAPAELRKIKHKQEDHFRPRADRRASFRPGEASSDRAELPHRKDIAVLFQLIGLLYSSLPPNRAIQFWGGFLHSDAPAAPFEILENERGKLPSFLRWAVEVREPDLIIGVFDMLAGFSTGVACSECAYNFMATGTLDVVHGAASIGTGVGGGRYEMAAAFTWGSIFGELESWAALGANHRGGHGVPPPQLPIAPKDVLLGLSFLKLLSVVVSYSSQARHAIFSHPQYRAISCLVSLIPLGVPLELKGALFDTLSAFCQPGAGPLGVDICKTVWMQMERLEVINVRGVGFASKGVEVELEEVEAVYKVYPATLPFLELLATLIHTPKRVSIKSRVSENEPINTVPENLGQPYRIPGIGPYVAFVVDIILARFPRREFLNQSDQWRMADLAMCFLERCLASYDLESLPAFAEEYSTKGIEALFPLLHHPGFDVLVRILSDTPFRSTLITYVVEGSEQLQGQQTNLQFSNVVLRALRIMDRVLVIQDVFLDHLIPALSNFDSASIAGINISQSFLSKIDQGLSLNQKSIPHIGTYVSHAAYPEIIFLSIKILSSLAQAPSFQNIATLIEKSSESNVILDGFVRLLSTESAQDVAAAEEWADLWTGAGAPDSEENELFGQAIRVAILDLLLRGTRRNKASSLALWLLFGKSNSDAQIQDPHALGARAFCLHIILHLLNGGVPRMSGKGKERDRHHAIKQKPLFETQPVLAERLYKLMYQLCDHPRTSSAMMLYLRTREDFFVRHLSVIAVHCPIDERSPHIEMEYGDGSRVVSTCATLKAFLQLRSWLLDLVSLELHILTNKGQHQRVKELLDLLFGTTDSYHEADDDWEHDIFRPFNDVSQSRIRIIEIFQSLEFTWYDSVTVSPLELQFYAQLNLQACVRPDENGCEVVDRNALFQLLTGARRLALRQGQIATPAQSAQLEIETKYILESCVAENNRREVQFSLNTGYEAWKRLLDVVLTKCFNRIAHDQRENILFDLIHVLPPSIRSSTLSEPSAVLLTEALLLLITKLREERRQTLLLSSNEGLDATALPAERMLGLLHHILDCVLDKQRQEIVRGNLYASLTNYLHLIHPQTEQSKQNTLRASSSFSVDSSLSSSMANSLSLSTRNGRASSPNASLESSSYVVLKQVMDRLVATIAKDAVDGAEVWKTVAFTLLESLARLSRLDTKHLVLAALDRYGLLLNFVHGIRDADESLQSVLRPDPDDLNPLYVYEAKMSFLIRLAESRHGAERLLESRLLPILAQVDFLDSRPESDESYAERDNFLPSALSRYHQLLVPALQLVGVIIATLGPKHAMVAKQAPDFLQNHRDTFVIMLKQDTSNMTLAMLDELDLIVSICSLVMPSIPKSDLLNVNTGFGSLHNAILALTARYFSGMSWTRYIRPADETEQIESQTRASGYGANGSKFDVRVTHTSQKLRKTSLSYLSVANGLEETDTTLVLSPLTSSRQVERTPTSAPLPSLNDAIEALNGFCDDLMNTLQDILDIRAELEHKDHVRIDNVEELIGAVDTEAIRRLDMSQRRSLVVRILEQSLSSRKFCAENLLSTLEILLLLIWRHVSYYADPERSSTAQATASIPRPTMGEVRLKEQSHMRASAMRFLVVPDASAFQKDAAAALGRVLEKVDGIELNEGFVYGDWRSTRSYFDVICRRLREAVELDQHDGREKQL